MILGNRNVASGKKLLKTSKIFFPVDMEICFWFGSRYCYLQFLGVWFSSNFDFFSLVSDRWKEWKEYREENLRPRTVKSFRLWIRFGGKDRPGFVWKEMLDVKWSKARNCISKKQKIIKMTMKIISLFGIDWDGPRKNYQFPIIWTALSNITSPTAM